jgi:hypothetical protein
MSSSPVSIDTTVTNETSSPKRVKLKSKAKFNNYTVYFTVTEDTVAADAELGSGTLTTKGVGTILAPTDQMTALLRYDVGDSVLVSFDYTSHMWVDNVEFG